MTNYTFYNGDKDKCMQAYAEQCKTWSRQLSFGDWLFDEYSNEQCFKKNVDRWRFYTLDCVLDEFRHQTCKVGSNSIIGFEKWLEEVH